MLLWVACRLRRWQEGAAAAAAQLGDQPFPGELPGEQPAVAAAGDVQQLLPCMHGRARRRCRPARPRLLPPHAQDQAENE